MIFLNLILFLISLLALTKSADYSTTYSHKLTKIFRLPEFIVSFFIVAIISTLPEGTISIISALKGTPHFGLGTLLGSNVADLTLVFGIVSLFSHTGIQIKSTVIRRNLPYLLLLVFPVILGFDGKFSRVDGILLVLLGLFFFFTLLMQSKIFRKHGEVPNDKHIFKNLTLLLLSLVFLLVSAYYTIDFGTKFANEIGLPVVLVSMAFVSIGTCLPEMIFSIKAIKTNHDGLAMGDIFGTVIANVTIYLGIMCLISPFQFNPTLIYITGTAMALASIIVIVFFRTEKVLTKKEGIFLIFFYIIYLIAEFIGNKVF